jgi:hypothetical protein
MLHVCTAPGCTVLTIGPYCLAHEPVAEPRVFPRGRPYRLKDREGLPAMVALPGKTSEPDVVLVEGAP